MDYVDMVGLVLPKVRGCPEAVAVNAMRETCVEWCTDTFALVTGITATSAAGEAELSMGEEIVLDIIDARIDGTPMMRTSPDWPPELKA